MPSVSIILPAKNEAENLRRLLPTLLREMNDAEIIVVDDGSSDDTSRICEEGGVRVVRHPYSQGNGAAIKSGARAATGDVLVFMDADGQHQPRDVHRLLEKLASGYDMVVGARARSSQATAGRWLANSFYNRLASLMVDRDVRDLTSGFRAVRAPLFRQFIHLLPNTFSYPTTITMAFFRAGFSVGYEDIEVLARGGKSHIKPLQDGMRFLLIIFKIATLHSPLRLFFPISLLFFVVAFLYGSYTLAAKGSFTNMSALLFSVSVLIFLIGLVSEQITALTYQTSRIRSERPEPTAR